MLPEGVPVPRCRSAAVVLALLGAVACHRAPTDDEVVAAVLARHPIDARINGAYLDADVRMLVVERRELEPLVSVASTGAHVRCGTGAGQLPCEEIRKREDLYGGYTTCNEEVFVTDGSVGEMRLRCFSSGDWPLVAPFDLDAFGAAKPTANGLLYVFRDAALLAKARVDRVGDLGPLAPVVIPPELADAYDTLTSPLSPLDLGEACGEVGRPGRGHTETEALVQAGRFDLLRNVARSLNPEGRVFAARALLQHAQPLLAEDVALLEKIRATTRQLRACQGCGLGWKDASELLAAPSAR
jgi:hypothetical protein